MDNIPSNLLKLKKNIDSVKDKISSYKNVMNDLQNDINKIDTNLNNYIKFINKPKNKKKNGFAAPKPISNELANFLNIPHDTFISRTEVTKYITKYIKENNLQNPDDKTQIIPDNKLNNILNITSDDKITFFTIQKYLNVHFIQK